MTELTDFHGNVYAVTLEDVTVTTPDGFTATSHTAQDALDGAVAKREEAKTSITLSVPLGSSLEDLKYWSKRGEALLGQSVNLVIKSSIANKAT